jgi:ATPase subunit of ABC transporter with duplicated ATPase domains
MYSGCAVIISHDFMFLNRVATHILDVDYGMIIPYSGNYDDFVRQKRATREQKEAEIARQKKIVADKLAFIERFRSKATKARQAQSRVKQVEKIEIEEIAETSRRHPRFRFEQSRPSGRDVLTVENLSKDFGEKKVLSDVSLLVRRGERVAVIGANGLGKSTLIKILASRLDPTSGRAQWGHEARIGYFAQDHKDLLENPRVTPLSFIWDLIPEEGTAYVRGQLGRMLFNSDDVEKSVLALSGGEAARLIFCQLIVQKANVLLLDEPTNHLDLEAIEALADALLAYEGTLVFVSHDRWFVSKLATRVIELRADGITDFAGTYEEYLAKSGEDHLDESAVVLKAKRDKAAGKSTSTELSYQERKRLQNRLKTLPTKRDDVLEEISRLESRVAEIQARYAAPELYETTGTAAQQAAELLTRLRREESDAEERILSLSAEWEALEGELAALQAMEL